MVQFKVHIRQAGRALVRKSQRGLAKQIPFMVTTPLTRIKVESKSRAYSMQGVCVVAHRGWCVDLLLAVSVTSSGTANAGEVSERVCSLVLRAIRAKSVPLGITF